MLSPTAHRLRPSWMRAVVLAAIAGLAMPATASAHAELIQATPAPNASLGASPAEVTIAFSEPIDPEAAFVDLVDRSQNRVAGVGPVAVEADGRLVRVELPPLDPGPYTVSYQVVSAVDGHATIGSYAFLVDPTGAAAPPTQPQTASSPSVDPVTVGARWVGLIGLLVALGSLVAWWRGRAVLADRLPPTATGPPWGLVAGVSAVGAIGVVGYLWLSARPIVEALGPDAAGFPIDVAGPFGWSPFAVAMRVTLVALLAVAVLAVLARARTDARLATAATVLLAVGVAGMSVAGHATSYGGPAFAVVDWLHQLAAAAWLGALPALLVLARRGRAPHGPGARPLAGALLRRHGALAIVAAPLVALTGIANSPLVLGTPRDVVSSDYGNLLLAKATLLAVAVGIGAVNHLALRGRGRAAIATMIVAELAVAALAVGVAATMVTIQPASARQPVLTALPVNPAHLFGEVGGSDVHATVTPPAPGPQAIQVSITERDTGLPRADVEAVTVELDPPPASGAEEVHLELDEAETVPGLFGASGEFTGEVGDWQLELVIGLDDGGEERLAFEVPVSRQAPPEPVPPPDTGIGAPGIVASVWSVLPPGPAAWLLPIGALALFVVVGRRRTPWSRVARTGLVGVFVVTGLGVATRSLVEAANRPTSEAALVSPPPSGTPADIARGEGIYLANCASCHGRDGAGDGPIVTSPPSGSIVDAVRGTSAADLSYRIAYGVAGTPMPAFAGTLTQDERWALVAYLRDRWAEP